MNWDRDGADWPHAAQSRFIRCAPHHWHVQEMGDGPLLLLLHGAGGATQSWRHLMPLLAQAHRVVAVDLPGQGFTKLGGLQRCGLRQMADDLGKLCMQEGWQPAALIGHSAGAAIALQMTLDAAPAPSVIGINAALGNFKGLAGILFPMMAKALAMTPWVAHLFTASTARPGSVERLIAGTGSVLPPEELHWYRQLIGSRSHVDATLSMMAQWDLNPLLRRVPAHPSEVLLITAEKDTTVPPRTSADVAARMQNASVVSLPGLGHLAHEEDAEAVFEEMQPVLASLQKG